MRPSECVKLSFPDFEMKPIVCNVLLILELVRFIFHAPCRTSLAYLHHRLTMEAAESSVGVGFKLCGQ